MRKQTIEKNLKKALLENGAFAQALFEYELQGHVEAYIESKHEDGDKYLIVVTENANDAAMLLIDENDTVHVNEKARSLLMKLWRHHAYEKNLRHLIPDMANELDSGYLYAAGVKIKNRT
jgi:vacuolar-type H+-ATPase subunit E/Vma4